MGGVPRLATHFDTISSVAHKAHAMRNLIGDGLSVNLLLRHGASVTTTDNAGMTPLHWAAVKGSKVCVSHLIEAGAEIDAKEESGKTPRDMADELKGLVPFNKGMEAAGFGANGQKLYGRLSEVSI